MNKLLKMIALLASYWIVLYTVYQYTDILKGPGFKHAVFMIVLTTLYTYLLSAINKETFSLTFSIPAMIFYVIGVVGFYICAGAGFNNGAAWLVSIVATAFLITGVVEFNE